MGKQIETETSVGIWLIVKPKAGVRNRALAKAETSDGGFKRMTFMAELLPRCIGRRPENFDKDVPIEQQLDDLEMEDYDKLTSALSSIIVGDTEEEAEKKKT